MILTRRSNSETFSNIERAEIGNENDADLVVRIHAYGSNNQSINGASMLVPGDVGYADDICEVSEQYGRSILDAMTDEVGMKNRGIVEKKILEDLTGLKSLSFWVKWDLCQIHKKISC